jgi:hypothetical protein
MRSQGQTTHAAVEGADEISGAGASVLSADTPLNSAKEFVHREFEWDGGPGRPPATAAATSLPPAPPNGSIQAAPPETPAAVIAR